MKQMVSIAALACATAATVRSPSARAQAVLPPPPQPVVVVERPVLPNPVLFRSGVSIFAVSYLPAVGVAFFSDHKGDANLFIPVAGPWIHLGTRDCAGAVVSTGDGPVEVSSGSKCGTSGWAEAALITDGIVQGVGALTFLSSLIIPEHRLTAWAGRSPNFSVGPTSFGGRGAGAVAAGRF